MITFSKKNYFPTFCSVLTLFFALSTLCARQASELHLYQIMQASPEQRPIISEKLNSIVQGINNGLLVDCIDIQEQFLALCDFFSDKEINAQNVPLFKEKINALSCSVREFYKERKLDLKPETRALLKDIYKFNKMLESDVLNDEQFKVTLFDRFLDTFLRRPAKFVGENKLLVGGISFVTVAAISYLIYSFLTNVNSAHRYPPGHVFHVEIDPAAIVRGQANRIQPIDGAVPQRVINTHLGQENWVDFQQAFEPSRLLAQGLREATAPEVEAVREYINRAFLNIRQASLARGIDQIELAPPLHMANQVRPNEQYPMLNLNQIQTGDQFIAFVREN